MWTELERAPVINECHLYKYNNIVFTTSSVCVLSALLFRCRRAVNIVNKGRKNRLYILKFS